MKDTKTAKEIFVLQLNILKQQFCHLAMTHAKNSKNTFFFVIKHTKNSKNLFFATEHTNTAFFSITLIKSFGKDQLGNINLTFCYG